MIYIKHIRELYKQFNVKLILNHEPLAGSADTQKRTISINLRYHRSDIDLLDTIFHELSHILSLDHGKFINYYRGNNKQIRSLALRAERYCDVMSRKFIKSLYPDIRMPPGSYSSPDSSQWLKDYYKS
jgi:hypothetical protein